MRIELLTKRGKLYIPSPERIADAVREVHGYSR